MSLSLALFLMAVAYTVGLVAGFANEDAEMDTRLGIIFISGVVWVAGFFSILYFFANHVKIVN